MHWGKHIPVCQIIFQTKLREGVKKREYYTVRLTVSVYPPRSVFCEIFRCVFYLRLWFFIFWNGFDTRKVIFIKLLEFPTPPHCHYSVTKRSDSGIAEAFKALKMHFLDPSQWDKMCFEYHRVMFHWKEWVKIFTFAYGQGRQGCPPPPYSQPDRKI